MKKLILGSLFSLLSLSVSAVEVAGVNVPDNVQAGEQKLVLNGAGSRMMAGLFHVYVIALYLPEKKHGIEEILSDEMIKRVTLNFLFDVKSTQLLDATHKLMIENHSPEELKKLDSGWKEFSAPFDTLKDIKKNDQLVLDYSSQKGIKMSLSGKDIGKITEAGFMRAFLKVWLGENPAQADLKDRLLGR